MQGTRLYIKDTVYICKSGKAEIFLAQDIWLKQKCRGAVVEFQALKLS